MTSLRLSRNDPNDDDEINDPDDAHASDLNSKRQRCEMAGSGSNAYASNDDEPVIPLKKQKLATSDNQREVPLIKAHSTNTMQGSEKECTKCGELKGLDAFVDGGKKCRDCQRKKFKCICKAPGNVAARCIVHMGSSICECIKEKRFCAEHGGSGLCECGKRKGNCTLHSGRACACGKMKSHCAKHGGSALCACGKLKQFCKEHGGKTFCPCGKRKRQCKIHGGAGLCDCGKDKHLCALHGGGGLCECGVNRSNCKKHGRSKLCECGKQKGLCAIHGGTGLCACGKVKQYCKKCGGSQICPCGKQKKNCSLHGGAALCQCGKIRHNCRKCNSANFCECGKKKVLCAIHGGTGLCACGKPKGECQKHGGSRFCECGKRKSHCTEHGGSAFCECGKQKRYCVIHGGSALCECGIRQYNCAEHGGTGICEHGQGKSYCRKCDGSQICACGKAKRKCAKHGGSSLCECGTTRNSKYGDGSYCTPCYMHHHPDAEIARNHRVKKENMVFDLYDKLYPLYAWESTNKRIPNDCKVQRRPDRFNDFGTHALIWEVDEGKHKSYSSQCEEVRLNEISTALNDKACVYLRFNPDSYKNEKGRSVKGCFSLTPKIGKLKMDKAEVERMTQRLKVLHAEVEKYSHYENVKKLLGTDSLIKQIYLFYDGYQSSAI